MAQAIATEIGEVISYAENQNQGVSEDATDQCVANGWERSARGGPRGGNQD